MHHYVNSIDDTKGNALIGFFVRCVDATTGLSASLYADASLTPILSVSGLANAAQVNADGNADFYILPGTYHLDIYATDGTTFVRRIQNLPMIEDLSTTILITPQSFGAKADGVTDDSAAFVAAIAALRAEALNNGSVYYNGSRSLFIPAGHYYLGTTALDITHTLAIQGEGSGQFGPGSGGCTRLRWADGSDGIRIQAANTSGNTAFDNVTIHDGAGGVTIADICLQGGFNGTTESDHHGLVIRNAIKATNLYIKNWPGEGVKAWAGNVTGQPAVSGNVSTTMLVGVKTEGCRGGIDIRGSDANVVTTINCEGYQNRWFGLIDDNGAGSNVHIGFHCASNGGVTGTWQQTQCSNGGQQYALAWGGDPTIAPSGTTADTANWYWIQAGAPVVNTIPAWVATPNTFRAGGDYLTLNSAGVQLVQCYSENGGFSQFNSFTLIEHGTMAANWYRGGVQFAPNGSDGAVIKRRGNNHFDLDFSGTEAGLQARDLLTASVLAYLVFVRGAKWWLSTGLNIQTGTLDFGGTTAIDASRNATLAAVTNTSMASTGAVTSSSATAGVGYATGAGGAVTQATSKSTGATLNKICGQVTMNAASLAATTAVSFTLTNSTIAAQDTVIVNIGNGATAGAYVATVDNVGPGSCRISLYNRTAGALAETVVLNFTVLKGVVA